MRWLIGGTRLGPRPRGSQLQGRPAAVSKAGRPDEAPPPLSDSRPPRSADQIGVHQRHGYVPSGEERPAPETRPLAAGHPKVDTRRGQLEDGQLPAEEPELEERQQLGVPPAAPLEAAQGGIDQQWNQLEDWRQLVAVAAGRLEEDRAGLEAQRQLLLATAARLEAERVSLIELRRQASDAASERSDLDLERSVLAAGRADLVAERAALAAERADLVAERADLVAERTDLTAGRTALNDQRRRFAAASAAVEAQHGELEAQRRLLDAARANFEAEVRSVEDQLQRPAGKSEVRMDEPIDLRPFEWPASGADVTTSDPRPIITNSADGRAEANDPAPPKRRKGLSRGQKPETAKAAPKVQGAYTPAEVARLLTKEGWKSR